MQEDMVVPSFTLKEDELMMEAGKTKIVCHCDYDESTDYFLCRNFRVKTFEYPKKRHLIMSHMRTYWDFSRHGLRFKVLHLPDTNLVSVVWDSKGRSGKHHFSRRA